MIVQYILLVLLLLSLGLNAWQFYRWHSYRARAAGSHSHTGYMQRITPEMIEADKKKGKR